MGSLQPTGDPYILVLCPARTLCTSWDALGRWHHGFKLFASGTLVQSFHLLISLPTPCPGSGHHKAQAPAPLHTLRVPILSPIRH